MKLRLLAYLASVLLVITPRVSSANTGYVAVEVEEKTIDVMRCIKQCRKQNEKEDSDVDCHDQCDPRRKSVVPSSGNNHDSAARCREDCHKKCNDLDCIFKCNERCFHNGKEGSEDTSDDDSEDTPSSTSDKDDGDTNSSHSSNNVDEFDGAGRLSCPGFSSSDKKECKLKKRCTLTNCVESYSMIEGWSGSTTPQGTFGQCGRVDIVVRNNECEIDCFGPEQCEFYSDATKLSLMTGIAVGVLGAILLA